jgi:hypothetical protein
MKAAQADAAGSMRLGPWLFALFDCAAVAYVWWSSLALPDVVASHFGTGGVADGFVPRADYVRLMVVLLVGVPTVLVVFTYRTIGNLDARINLPNAAYWLAPERRAATVSFLRAALLWFAVLLVVFLCDAHHLVVRANESHPVRLPQAGFVGGLVLFLVGLAVWMAAVYARFRRAR